MLQGERPVGIRRMTVFGPRHSRGSSLVPPAVVWQPEAGRGPLSLAAACLATRLGAQGLGVCPILYKRLLWLNKQIVTVSLRTA